MRASEADSFPQESGRAGWAVVAAYAAVVACTQMLWLTFAPIDTDVARDFGVSKNAIGWLAQVFPLLYVLLALPALRTCHGHPGIHERSLAHRQPAPGAPGV